MLKSSREKYLSSPKFYLAVRFQPHSNKISWPDALILPSFKWGLSRLTLVPPIWQKSEYLIYPYRKSGYQDVSDN